MRRGLATMVPVRALSLFTWQEVEVLIAGKPDVDVAVLKRHTRYESYTASHPVSESSRGRGARARARRCASAARRTASFPLSELTRLVHRRPTTPLRAVKRFWRVFASLSQQDRSNYVRFVWGRARLPADTGTWTSSHTIQRQSGGDRALPMAHTCFFTIGACWRPAACLPASARPPSSSSCCGRPS